MNSYTDFASAYDELMSNVDYEKIADFMKQILLEHGISEGILLDLACGTGSLAEIFAGYGYEVIGVDGSSDMLSEAMNKKILSGQDIVYLCQDMQELDLYGTVDAAVCTLDSLNHVNDLSTVQKILNRVSLFLNSGGIFIFDVNTVYKHQHVLGNNTFVYDCADVYCVWQNTLEEENRIKIHLDIFEQSGGSYHRYEEEFCETAYSDSVIQKLLNHAGMTVTACYDDYTKSLPGEKTQRVVYVAKKDR